MPGLTTVNFSISTDETTEVVTSISGERICVTSYHITTQDAAEVSFVTTEDSELISGIHFMSAATGNNQLKNSGPRDTPVILFPPDRSLGITGVSVTTLGGHITYYTTGAF